MIIVVCDADCVPCGPHIHDAACVPGDRLFDLSKLDKWRRSARVLTHYERWLWERNR